jgi:predicted metal-dependent enzyme (double-stranded beta helix superfamily)
MTALLTAHTDELRRLSELPTEPALRQAAAFLAGLVKDPGFVESRILPLLKEERGSEDWYVAHRCDGEHGAYSLEIFVWPPASGTRVHDHSSWGAYHCAWGSVLEERYERLDDGARAEHARLEKIWQLQWSPEDGASTVLPGDGGIHRVGNPGDSLAISVHLYGPRIGKLEGRDYDPVRDYVCDRRS